MRTVPDNTANVNGDSTVNRLSALRNSGDIESTHNEDASKASATATRAEWKLEREQGSARKVSDLRTVSHELAPSRGVTPESWDDAAISTVQKKRRAIDVPYVYVKVDGEFVPVDPSGTIRAFLYHDDGECSALHLDVEAPYSHHCDSCGYEGDASTSHQDLWYRADTSEVK